MSAPAAAPHPPVDQRIEVAEDAWPRLDAGEPDDEVTPAMRAVAAATTEEELTRAVAVVVSADECAREGGTSFTRLAWLLDHQAMLTVRRLIDAMPSPALRTLLAIALAHQRPERLAGRLSHADIGAICAAVEPGYRASIIETLLELNPLRAWPCEADVALLLDVVAASPLPPMSRVSVLVRLIADCTRNAVMPKTRFEIEENSRLLVRLVNGMAPNAESRLRVMCSIVRTNYPLVASYEVAHALFPRLDSDDHRHASIELEQHNYRLETYEHRGELTKGDDAELVPSGIKDEAAKEGAPPETVCIVCTTNVRRVTLVPCGHYQLCGECARRTLTAQKRECPTCRETVAQAIRVFH